MEIKNQTPALARRLEHKCLKHLAKWRSTLFYSRFKTWGGTGKYDAGAPMMALRNSLGEYRKRCGHIRHRRNKGIAHFDLSVQLGEKSEILPGPTRQEIEDALTALRQFMNIVFAHYEQTQMAYERFSLQSDGQTLLYELKKAQRYEQLQKLGTIPFDDIFKSPHFGV
ncbi:MAG TPA: hypothetical protein VF928_08230 [Usitatibacteraceae bacterium]